MESYMSARRITLTLPKLHLTDEMDEGHRYFQQERRYLHKHLKLGRRMFFLRGRYIHVDNDIGGDVTISVIKEGIIPQCENAIEEDYYLLDGGDYHQGGEVEAVVTAFADVLDDLHEYIKYKYANEKREMRKKTKRYRIILSPLNETLLARRDRFLVHVPIDVA
jgi:hypothetical protein